MSTFGFEIVSRRVRNVTPRTFTLTTYSHPCYAVPGFARLYEIKV